MLVFAIGVVGGRRLVKWLKATGRISYRSPKAKKEKKEKKEKKVKEVPDEVTDETEQPEAEKDDTLYDD